MNTYDTLRRFYARLVTATAGVEESGIIDAFASVRREYFVGPGPWQIQVLGGYMASGTDDPAVLYQDINIGLDPERRINNGEPSFHAKCMGAAAPRANDVVVHVGAGTGYYTAILAHLVGPSGRVHAYEIDAAMARRATENLTEHAAVTLYADSALAVPLPSADVIYVSAGATHVPGEWLDALKIGGRLVLPLTPNERLGCMLVVTRRSGAVYAARVLSTAAFFPCVGARDDSQSKILAAALNAQSTDAIRSLHRGGEPDDTAWCVGNGWWLSTADPVEDGGSPPGPKS
jgi:protein-L-isoaspartate(D-aspartate) O-methyltransferase